MSLVVVRLVVTVAYDARLSGRFQKPSAVKTWSYSQQARIAWVALPLGVLAMMNALAISVPRYALERYSGPRALGLFVAVASLVTVGSTFVAALGQVVMPRIALAFSKRDLVGFKRLALTTAAGGVALALAGVLTAVACGKQILSLAYRPEYSSDNNLLISMMIVGGVGYVASLLGYATTASRFFHAQLPVCTIMMGVTAVASYCLTPGYGLVGAVIAIGLGNAVHCVGQLAVLQRIWRHLRSSQLKELAGGASAQAA
jgi:O-antigen/teichoic acid export membrane protein